MSGLGEEPINQMFLPEFMCPTDNTEQVTSDYEAAPAPFVFLQCQPFLRPRYPLQA
jgi:hypothetical protein